MDIRKKKNRKQTSAFHAAEVMSHDLSLLRGKKLSSYFDDSEVKGLLSSDEIEKEVQQLKRIDGFLEKREENYFHLEKGLKEIEEIDLFQSTYGDFKSSYYCLSIVLKDNIAEKRFETINSNGVDFKNAIFSAEKGRDVEYYSGFLYDFVWNNNNESIYIGGGGRYDDLIKLLGSENRIPAVGAALNLKRVERISQIESL